MEEQQIAQPSFDCVRGAYGGYSLKCARVTKQNLRALVREIIEADGMPDRTQDLTWPEVWAAINRHQEWWWKCYAGQTCRVEATYLPPITMQEYLERKQEEGRKNIKPRNSGRSKKN